MSNLKEFKTQMESPATQNNSADSTCQSTDKNSRPPIGKIYLTLLAMAIGVACGMAAYIFKWLISVVTDLFQPHISAGHANWWLILLPIAGITLTGIYTRYIVRTDLSHCVAQLLRKLSEKKYRLKKTISFSPVIGGAITLGTGGSAGAEGPIAYTGAAIGSTLGQWMKLSPLRIRTLVGCGAGAGIAGIFCAPVGGIMFTIEILRMELTVESLLALVAACVSAYLTVQACNGFNVDLSFSNHAPYDPSYLPMIVLLGVFCGLYCIYYNYVVGKMDAFYSRISNPWVRNITGGTILGLMLFLFPALYGPGYKVISHIINGSFDVISTGSSIIHADGSLLTLALVAAGILLCKSWAMSATTGSGGVAGDFAPTLYAGGIAGFLFASVCNSWFGTSLPIETFAYIGMAGVMAGAIEAPWMAIFITMEMTQAYMFTLPLTACALTAYMIVKGAKWLNGNTHRLICHHNYFACGKEKGSQL